MNVHVGENDISHVVAADKAHIWHHLTQHKKFDIFRPPDHCRGQGHAGLESGGPVPP